MVVFSLTLVLFISAVWHLYNASLTHREPSIKDVRKRREGVKMKQTHAEMRGGQAEVADHMRSKTLTFS